MAMLFFMGCFCQQNDPELCKDLHPQKHESLSQKVAADQTFGGASARLPGNTKPKIML